MPVIELHRQSPLSPLEVSRLPGGCIVVEGQGEVVARANVELPLADFVRLAVAMGRAVPDARVEVPETRMATTQAPKAEPPPKPATPETDDPWQLVAAGHYDAAEEKLKGKALDTQGRERLRELLQSTDPVKIAAGCRLARATQWRSAVSSIRRHLDHADTRVRKAAVEAVGSLAGPGLVPTLQRMRQDASPEVRQSVEAAIREIEGEA